MARGKNKDKELVKVKSEEEENGMYDESSSSYRNPFLEDDAMGIEDCA